MSEDLEILWMKLRLTEEEEEEECGVELSDPIDSLMHEHSELCLVGKVLSDRLQSFEVVKDTMMAA